MKLIITKNSAKWMQLPRDVLVGHGVLKEVGDVCRDLKLKGNALIVTGSTTWDVAGKRVSELPWKYWQQRGDSFDVRSYHGGG